MAQQHVKMYMAVEKFVVIVCHGVGVAPFFLLQACEHKLGSSVLRALAAELIVRHGVGGPCLVGVVVSPAVSEFAAEREVFEWFPVQAGVVILLQAFLVFVCGCDTLQWSTACRCTVLFVIVITCFQLADGFVVHGIGNKAVCRVCLIGIGTSAQSVQLGESQSCVEVECHPLVEFGVEFGVDIVFCEAGAKHYALLVNVGETDVELQVFRTAVHTYVILFL